jgi:hypothetical protein
VRQNKQIVIHNHAMPISALDFEGGFFSFAGWKEAFIFAVLALVVGWFALSHGG